MDRGAISSSRGGGEDGKAAKMQRQRGTFGAAQAHQAELKIRRAKYARDFDGSHQGVRGRGGGQRPKRKRGAARPRAAKSGSGESAK